MTFIYDLIFNFNNDYYEFFEWFKNDNYVHIKRIYLLKVNSSIYNDLFNNRVQFGEEIAFNIHNKCEYLEKRELKVLPYALVITDGYRVMAITLDEDLIINNYSSLLLDEEEEVLEIAKKLPFVNIAYNIIKSNEFTNLTRKEKRILKYIANTLNKVYSDKDYERLHYFYYEYFNKDSNDPQFMYHKLMDSLQEFSDKHDNLYHLLKLSCNS